MFGGGMPEPQKQVIIQPKQIDDAAGNAAEAERLRRLRARGSASTFLSDMVMQPAGGMPAPGNKMLGGAI